MAAQTSLHDPHAPPEAHSGASNLDTYANNSSPPLTWANARLARRAARYDARRLLWAESGLERVRKCGRSRVGEYVALRHRNGVAGFAGVATCGSVWSCPVCNAKIMARRAIEIGSAVALWQRLDGRVALATFTMRHHQGQSLDTLWAAIGSAWSSMTSGKAWVTHRDRFGVAGWLRAVEVTHGRNGWHVHLHVLLFGAADLTPAKAARLHAWMVARWTAALARKGHEALAVGQDVRLVTGPDDDALGEYLTKAQYHPVGRELAYSQGKAARAELSTQPVWHLLDRIREGDADALTAWHQWEQASHSRRQITWSQDLRRIVGLAAERTDEAIASEELGSKDDDLLWITGAGWRTLCAADGLLPGLLTATEADGLAGARSFLDAHQVDYLLPARGVRDGVGSPTGVTPTLTPDPSSTPVLEPTPAPTRSAPPADASAPPPGTRRFELEDGLTIDIDLDELDAEDDDSGLCLGCGLPLDPAIVAAGLRQHIGPPAGSCGTWTSPPPCLCLLCTAYDDPDRLF